MAIVKLRIQADNESDCQEAIDKLSNVTQGAAKFGKPREGTNPRYAGSQKWSSYGEVDTNSIKPRRGGVI